MTLPAMYHAGRSPLGLVMLHLFGLTGSALIVLSTTMRSLVGSD